jgi:hypothetical protein
VVGIAPARLASSDRAAALRSAVTVRRTGRGSAVLGR